ncbi:MAG: hypothetical protein K2Q25_04200 [Mycobacteriaceae bacterium]|nr:hypothetical protein [Mycobacteriaceae bacterium]
MVFGLTTVTVPLVLLAPSSTASPQTDADDAITVTWQKAGGDGSVLGAKQGDSYAVGEGFAQNFTGGKIFFTPATGARFVYGPILDKYQSLGGPVGSDLGFPTINEVPGLAGPDSRVSIFSASDKPVIFWTPDHGAFVVRGPMNAAWDKLGSSGGVLGVPVADETYDGALVTQKFSGGQVSWDRMTNAFNTVPTELAEQLVGMQVPFDPAAAINMAWRSAGGSAGPLGAKQGGQYRIGDDGIGQDFSGGKIYFSPATGANAVESDVLAKYESLGGPLASGLGFPTANEADGGIPNSRISSFSADDKPVIFWTQDHGAFVVRGVLLSAWDKLRGPTGQLGAPVGDQAVDGDVVTQKFAGGKIAWNRVTNSFITEPSNLAPLLSGSPVLGQGKPSAVMKPVSSKGFPWLWGWSLVIVIVILVLLLGGTIALVIRRRRQQGEMGLETADPEFDRALGVGYRAIGDDQWSADNQRDTPEPGRADPVLDLDAHPDRLRDDADAADTAPTRIPVNTAAGRGRHAAPELEPADWIIDTAAEGDVPLTELGPGQVVRPLIHLPLADPYEVPQGYPVKGNVGLGLYYTPLSPLYGDTFAEIWFASERAAQANGFSKAD